MNSSESSTRRATQYLAIVRASVIPTSARTPMFCSPEICAKNLHSLSASSNTVKRLGRSRACAEPGDRKYLCAAVSKEIYSGGLLGSKVGNSAVVVFFETLHDSRVSSYVKNGTVSGRTGKEIIHDESARPFHINWA